MTGLPGSFKCAKKVEKDVKHRKHSLRETQISEKNEDMPLKKQKQSKGTSNQKTPEEKGKSPEGNSFQESYDTDTDDNAEFLDVTDIVFDIKEEMDNAIDSDQELVEKSVFDVKEKSDDVMDFEQELVEKSKQTKDLKTKVNENAVKVGTDRLWCGSLYYTVDEKDVDLWSSCTKKLKERVIDFLKNDLNNKEEESLHIVGQYSGIDCLSDLSREVVTLYEKVKTVPAWKLFKDNSNCCPFCDLAVNGKAMIEDHLKKHLVRLEETLESCMFCKVILPKGYMVYHPCTKKADRSMPGNITVWYSDVRDVVAYVETKLQFLDQDKAMVCHICNGQQTDPSNYWKHFMDNHVQTFKCDCSEVFSNRDDVIGHVTTVCIVNTDRCRHCKACKEKFKTLEEIYDHLKTVHNISQDLLCDMCGLSCVCEVVFENHKCQKRRIQSSHRCGIDNCEETFTTYRAAKKHKHEVHGIEKFLCTICGQRFLLSSNLKAHLEWAHGIGEPKECKLCHQMCRGPNTLRSHMLTHNADNSFSCEICGKLYKYRAGLKIHMDHSHKSNRVKKYFTCEVCQAIYTKKGSLNHHIIKMNHTTEKQKSVLRLAKPCKQCGKVFGTGVKLQRHMNQVHIKEKKMTCQFCGKGFDDKSNLRQHIQTHTGDKPCCDICKITFRSRRKLCSHMMEKHNIFMELSESDPLRIIKQAKNAVNTSNSGEETTHASVNIPVSDASIPITNHSTYHPSINSASAPYNIMTEDFSFSAVPVRTVEYNNG